MKYHIGQVKKELGLSQKDLADFFGMSYNSYANSSAKNRYEIALCRFYECVLLGGKKNETKNLTDTDHRVNDETEPLILYSVSQQSELLQKKQTHLKGHEPNCKCEPCQLLEKIFGNCG